MRWLQQSEPNLQFENNLGALPFTAKYVSRNEALSLLGDDRLFALINFAAPEKIDPLPQDPRCITIPLELLGDQGDDDLAFEAWFSRDAFKTGYYDGISYTITDDFIFGCIKTNEVDFPNIKTLGYDMYQRILGFTDAKGYPYILRAWNYLSSITRVDHDLERYQAFCVGRHDAFQLLPSFKGIFPAASTIGTRPDGSTLIYFIAAQGPGAQIENPRQVSAFKYPPLYGPRSPTFSRAIYKNWNGSHHVYISGTASVVGHETCHCDDARLQLEETLRNIEALALSLSEKHGVPIKGLLDMSLFKVYIRNEDDFDAIRWLIRSKLSDAVPCIYLKGDICRKDLLLEIEALYFK